MIAYMVPIQWSTFAPAHVPTRARATHRPFSSAFCALGRALLRFLPPISGLGNGSLRRVGRPRET
eukprot:1195655-Prorocentrum_minimum.AAC.4